jgi:lysozyme
MVRGAYHYAEIEGDPIKQARHYVQTVNAAGGFHKGDFAVLDAEDVDNASKHVGQNKTAQWCLTWMEEVVRLTGLPRRRVLLYTGNWWWGPRTGGSDIIAKAGYPLWLSAYTVKVPNTAPWRTWRFWQYTNGTHPKVGAAGRKYVPGIGNCDVSLFNGSSRGLWWLSGRPMHQFGKKK